MLSSGHLFENIGISLERAALGFALAVVVAIPLGFLMGRYALFERVTDFLVQTLRNTSQFALMPVFILVLGIGEASKVAICFYSAVFFLLINTIMGVKSVDPLLLKAARSMGTSDLDLFRKVIFPSAIPSIVAGARLAVKSALFSVIAAEMLAAQSGIGFLIQHAAADARDRRHVCRHHHPHHRRPAGELRPRRDRAPGDPLARQLGRRRVPHPLIRAARSARPKGQAK